MQTCHKCKEQFKGDGWQKYCVTCWKELRSKTTPASESKHPAVKAEQDYKAPTKVVVNKQYAAECIEKCFSELATVESVKAEKKSMSVSGRVNMNLGGECV
jgi:hypothetical protein